MNLILAIDPGKTSGWALFDCGWTTGVSMSAVDRQLAVARATQAERSTGQRLVVVGETWIATGVRRGREGRALSTQTVAGMGAAWGRWAEQLELHGVPKRRIVRVDSGTWRRAVLGATRQTTEQAKRAAMMRARAVLGHDVGPDEAEALMIGLWAERDPGVLALAGRGKVGA